MQDQPDVCPPDRLWCAGLSATLHRLAAVTRGGDMNKIDRRSFLSRTLAAGAGATLLEPLIAGAPEASASGPDPFDLLVEEDDPGFVGGVISDVYVDKVAGRPVNWTFVALDYDGNVQRLHAT